MAQLGTAYIKIAPDLTGIQNKVASAFRPAGATAAKEMSKGISGSSAAIAGAVGGIVASATNKAISTVTASIGDAIKRVDILNAFPKVMSNIGIGAEAAAKAQDKLIKGLQGLPTSLDSSVSAVQRFTMKTKDVSRAADVYLALNNAILAGGGAMDIQASAAEQFAQAFSRGKPDLMEWRTILTAMPAQLDQLAKSFGKPDTDALYQSIKKGNITMEQLSEKLIQLNSKGIGGMPSFAEQAKNATGGISTGFANMRTSVVRGVASIVQSIGSDEISQAASKTGGAFETVLKGIASTIPKIKNIVSTQVFPIISSIGDRIADQGPRIREIMMTKILPRIVGVAKDAKEGDFSALGEKIGKGIGTGIGLAFDLFSISQEAITKWFSKINWAKLGMEIGRNAFAFVLGLVTGLFSTDFLSTAFNFVRENWAAVLLATLTIAFAPSKLLAPITRIFANLFAKVPFGQTIYNMISGGAKVVRGAFTPIREAVSSVFSTLFSTPLRGAISGMGNILKTVGNVLVSPFKEAIDRIALMIRFIPVTLSNTWAAVTKTFQRAGGSIGSFIGNAVKSALNLVIDKLNSVKILGKGLNIPRLADGGIVKARQGGTLAVIGEGRHDEAVIPLKDSNNPLAGGGVTINNTNNFIRQSDPDAFSRRLAFDLGFI